MSGAGCQADFVVIGGGIAGVSCAELLARSSPASVVLITASPLLKGVANERKISEVLEDFDVVEQPLDSLKYPNLRVVRAVVTRVDTHNRSVVLSDGAQRVRYRRALCLAQGARPHLAVKDHPLVLGIRDTDSVATLREKLHGARRVAVLGNGGIALEFVGAVRGVDVLWAVKDSYIGNTFFDPAASAFLVPELLGDTTTNNVTCDKDGDDAHMTKQAACLCDRADAAPSSCSDGQAGAKFGNAIGPQWDEQLGGQQTSRRVHIEHNVTLVRVCDQDTLPADAEVYQPAAFALPGSADAKVEAADHQRDSNERRWPLYLLLSNGKWFGVDLCLSATGVVPNTDAPLLGPEFQRSDQDHGVLVDASMRTSVADVYAAGDVCSVRRDCFDSPHWFQMRLWSQARVMGQWAGKCMLGDADELAIGFNFELFAHVTRFFGYKVVLLGRFNAQDLQRACLLVRQDPGRPQQERAYLKVVSQDGRMRGAMLIGETDLEETFENLILNGLDISRYGDDLLNPDIDIEDYFD